MGIRFSTYCKDCRENAPEIGDGGHIGLPILKVHKEYHYYSGDKIASYSFGWFYSGFKAINLIPYNLEAFRLFLRKHNNHNVLTISDGDETEPEEDNYIGEYKQFKENMNGFIKGYWQIINTTTQKSFTSPTLEFFKPFHQTELTVNNLKLFKNRINDSGECLDQLNNTFGMLAPWEGLGQLLAFLSENEYFLDIPNKGSKIIVNILGEDRNIISDHVIQEAIHLQKTWRNQVISERKNIRKAQQKDLTPIQLAQKQISRWAKSGWFENDSIEDQNTLNTALWLAVDRNLVSIAKTIIDLGGVPKQSDLLFCIRHHLVDLVKILINGGVDLSSTDSDGKKPLDIAVSGTNLEIIKIIKDSLEKDIVQITNCSCDSMLESLAVTEPEQLYFSDFSVTATNEERELNLIECTVCGQLWQYGLQKVINTVMAIKVESVSSWKNFSDKKFQIEQIINSKGGLSDKKCSQYGCENKRVNDMYLCGSHLFESMDYKNRR